MRQKPNKKGGRKAALSQIPDDRRQPPWRLVRGGGPLLLAVALMPCSRSAAAFSALSFGTPPGTGPMVEAIDVSD
jgi:hypothetical protein